MSATTKHPDDFRFLDAETQKCPWEFYKVLREQAPVYKEPETGFYIVSRADDLVDVKTKTEIFSSDFRLPSGQVKFPEAAKAYVRQGYKRPQTLHRTDPPAHTHYRKLIDRTFTMPRVREMTPYIEGIVCDLFDDFSASGEVDFVSQYAIPLPCLIIADQLGVPREDALKLKTWSDALLDPTGLMIDETRTVECAKLTLEFQQYFAARIEERRNNPRNDILSDLSARVDGEDAYSIPELLNILEQIVTGGNESTTGLLSSALLLLIRHPEQQQRLREDPSLIPNFVEEALRMESPVQSNFRRATRDTELSGVKIPEGSILLLRYGAANRDETRFDQPEEMDVCRSNARRHFAFGFGIHHCPGSLLARQEAISTFKELLKRFERFELRVMEGQLRYHPTFFLRGLESLPVRLVRGSG